MQPGTRVTVSGRSGVVKALRPGNSVDVQFDGEPFTTRHDARHVIPVRENPGKRGGLTPPERASLPDSVFALPGRRFPINDRRHAVIAMQYILRGFVGHGDAPTVLRAIHDRYPPSDRRNAEIWAFYEKHKHKLLRPKTAGKRSKVVAAAANPQDDVYNFFQEHLRAQEQGVYESLVTKELGLPSKTEFKDDRGRRLDEKLDADTKRRLLSKAIAITVGQQQKYGYLVPGTRQPTKKGIERAMQRLSERGHAEENRQDYERTLGAVRKSGHYRVVAEIVNGQKRYVVQPRPPEDLIKIPEYRLSEEKAREDANRAEAAFHKAPKALKARANPYYSTVYGSTVRPYDIDDEPASTIIQDGDTFGSIASRLGVSPSMLVFGQLQQMEDGQWYAARPLRWFQAKKGRELVTPRNLNVRTPLTDLANEVEAGEAVDPALAGYRVVKRWDGGSMAESFEAAYGAAKEKYATRELRDADSAALGKRRLEAAATKSAAERKRAELETRKTGTAERKYSTRELKAELTSIKATPGWDNYVRKQQHAQMVDQTTRQGKGGALPREAARRGIEDSYTVLGRGVLGPAADEMDAFNVGKALAERAESIEVEISERQRQAEASIAERARREEAGEQVEAASAATTAASREAEAKTRKQAQADAEAIRKAEARARLDELMLEEEAAYNVDRRVKSTRAGREASLAAVMVTSSRASPEYLRGKAVIFGRELIGENAPEDAAVAAAMAELELFTKASLVLGNLYALRRSLDIDPTPLPALRERDDQRAARLLEATNIVAALAPLRAELEKAGKAFLEPRGLTGGRDLELIRTARTGGREVDLERLGRRLLGETVKTHQADRVPEKTAIDEANKFFAEYEKTQGLVDNLDAAEKYLTPVSQTRGGGAIGVRVVDPLTAILESETSGKSAVKAALNKSMPGDAGEIFDALWKGLLAEEYVIQQAAPGNPPEVQAANAAALKQFRLRKPGGTGVNLMRSITSGLAPGKVIVVVLPVKSAAFKGRFIFPRVYVVPYGFDRSKDLEQGESAERSLVWSLLMAKPDAKLGTHIFVLDNVDEAEAFIRSRIDYQKSLGTKINNEIASLLEATLSTPPSMLSLYPPPYPSLETQIAWFERDKNLAAGRVRVAERTMVPSGQSLRSLERELTGAGGAALGALTRRVITQQQRDLAIKTAEEQIEQEEGSAPMSFNEYRRRREKAREMASKVIQESGLSVGAAEALAEDMKTAPRTLLMAEIPNLGYSNLRQARASQVRGQNLNKLRERVLGPLKRAAETPTERAARRLPGQDRFDRAFYDVEFVYNPKTGEDEVRYILYVPKVLQFITRVQRVMGMTVLAEPDSYVRFSKSAPERGPLATPAAPPGTYDMVTRAIAEAREGLAAAKAKGGPLTFMIALDKLKKAFADERRYKRSLMGANSPYATTGETIQIRGARKLALFVDTSGVLPRTAKEIAAQQALAEETNKKAAAAVPEDDFLKQYAGVGGETEEAATPGFRTPESNEDIFADITSDYSSKMGELGEEAFTSKIVTANEGFMEDKSFRAEIRRSSVRDIASGRTFTADDRKRYAKYYTTNPLLAYYTIFLWNTPELFNGTVVDLHYPVKWEGKTLNDIRTGDVFTDNPNRNPYKVYDELLAQGVRLRGILIAASLTAESTEDWINVARMHINLYGAKPEPGEPPIEGYVDAVNKIIRGMEPLESAREVFGLWGYQRRRMEAYEYVNRLLSLAERLRDDESLSDSTREKQEVRVQKYTEAKRKFNQISKLAVFENTRVGIMLQEDTLRAILYGQADSPEIQAAYKDAVADVQKALNKRYEQLRHEVDSARGLPAEAQRQLQDNLQTVIDLNELLRSGMRVGPPVSDEP